MKKEKMKFSLVNYMIDIADNFWSNNPNLKPVCMLESIETGNYETKEQYLFMHRYIEIWDKVQERSLRGVC